MQAHAQPASELQQEGSGATQALVALASSLQWHDIPATVVHAAKRHLLDTCGAILGGMSMDVATKIVGIGGVANHIRQGIPAPGSALRLDAPSFAFLCGTAAHGIELDDGYREGSVHPGVTVVPAVLATAFEQDVTGRELLAAMIVGYETVTAIAGAAHPALRDRGFHPTSVVGTFGACLASGRLLGLGGDAMQNAMGIAASSSAGLFAFLDGGGDVKRLHAGQASRGGLLAARFAGAGISGPLDVIERSSGFSQAFAYGTQREKLRFDVPPAGPFRTARCYIKPYACCRHLQPAIDAVVKIMADHRLSARDILAVDVEAYTIAASHAGTGWNDFASAQMSFPYVLAVAMANGTVDLCHFDDATRADAGLAALARLVRVRGTSGMDALYPRQRPSRVTMETRSGTFTEFSAEALGAPEKPVDDRRLEAKFMSLAAPAIGEASATQVLRTIWTIDEMSTVRPLLDQMSRSAAAARG